MTIAAPFLGVVGLLASQRMLVRSGDAITVSTRNVLRQNKTVAVQVFLATNLRSNEDLEQISMINTFESAEGLAVTAAARSGRFDPTSIVLHWLTVLLIIGQFTTAWLHEAVGHGIIPALEILPTHRTMGVLTWTVGLRQRFTYLQQWIAKTNEYRLYVLLLMQPITGLGDVVFHGRPFTLASAGAIRTGRGNPEPVSGGS